MGTKRKINISVAPVGGVGQDNRREVIKPDMLIEELVRCESAGASIVHLHVKDPAGHPTTDRQIFDEIIDGLRNRTGMIIQGSTGGDESQSAEDRCVALDNPHVEMASLNMGSTNFFEGVYVNSPGDIRYWAERMKGTGVKPELEIFSPDMIEAAGFLYENKLLDPPFDFGICLGIPWAMPSDPRYLCICSQLMPEGVNWGLIEFGRRDFSMVAVALALGASWIRVGREDAPEKALHEESPVSGNPELVMDVRRFIESLGYGIATPDEARSMLGVENE